MHQRFWNSAAKPASGPLRSVPATGCAGITTWFGSAAVSAAAVELAKALNGLVVNGVVNAPGVNAAVSAYNDYVAKLVAAVGGTEATAILSKDASVKNTLTALVKAGGG